MTFARLTVSAALSIVAVAALTACEAQPTVPTASPTASTATPTPRATDADGTVPLTGYGIPWQGGMIEAWTAQLDEPSPAVTYGVRTTAVARTMFADGTADFVGADRAYTPAEIQETVFSACAPDAALAEIPVSIGSISVVFNLPGVRELRLDAATLAGIFTGKITVWNDPVIAAENAGVALPELPITPVHVAGASGVTSNFTDYLSAGAESIWTFGSVERWPKLGGRTSDEGNVATTIGGIEGAIGYVDTLAAGRLPSALLRVGDQYVQASPITAAASVNAVTTETAAATRVVVEVDRTPGTPAYPLAVVNWLIGCSAYDDPRATAEIRSLFAAAVSAESQAAVADTGLAPVTASLRARALKAAAAIGAVEATASVNGR